MNLIILDRDGVVNHDAKSYITSPDHWHPIPGSLDAIARLSHAGVRVVVATNQSGIARGLYDIDDLNRIHQKMHAHVQERGGHIEAILFSPSADDNDPTRKPNSGMLIEIASRLATSLRGIPFIGDSLRDIQAARTVGAHPILVRTGNGTETERQFPNVLPPEDIYNDLNQFASYYLSNSLSETANR